MSPSGVFSSFAAQLSAVRGDSLSQNARNLALINMAISDALVASFMNKYLLRLLARGDGHSSGGSEYDLRAVHRDPVLSRLSIEPRER